MAEEAIHNPDSGESDVSTIHHAASKIASLMDGQPSEESDVTHPEETEESPEQLEADDSAEQPEEVEPTDDEPTDTDVVQNFSDLAEHLGVEESFLETLVIPTKVNGQERNSTIKDLVASYQKGETAEVRLDELSEQRKQFNSEVEKASEQLQQEWSRAQSLNQELQNLLTGDDDAQLNSLRHSDPAEYAARMAEKQQKLQRAERLNRELNESTNHKVIEQYKTKVSEERNKLFESMPEWSDDKVRESESVKIRSYLKGEGFEDFEIDGKIEDGRLMHPGMIDYRAMVIARKAMLYDEARKGSEPKKKRLKSLPKVGAGKPKSKADLRAVKDTEVRGRVKKTGKLDDAALAIQQLMEN